MKAYLYRTVLATVLAIFSGTLASECLLAQTCAPFPAGVVPFLLIHYLSGTSELVLTNASGRQDSKEWIQIQSILDRFAPGTTREYAHIDANRREELVYRLRSRERRRPT